MMWEIIEKSRNPRDYRDRDYRNSRRDYNEDYRMGMKYSDDYKEEIEDAYTCGYEKGYKEGRMSISDYGERRMGR